LPYSDLQTREPLPAPDREATAPPSPRESSWG
jgi:hypothetical protein